MKPKQRQHVLNRIVNAARFARQHARLAWQERGRDETYHQQMRTAFMDAARRAKRSLAT